MKRTQKLIIVATLLIVIALLTLVACDINKSANKKLNEGVNNAKTRANNTASTYNNYILKNSYVWKDNIPSDIKTKLDYVE